MVESPKASSRTYWLVAYASLHVAHSLKKEGAFREAMAMACDAIYYALIAGIRALDVPWKKPAKIEIALSKYLIRPGYVEEEFKDLFLHLIRLGRMYLNEPYFVITDREIVDFLQGAERFVTRIDQFLQEQDSAVVSEEKHDSAGP